MKKLTAGIFTVMLGLVAVNAANAAIPSTNYVDTKITTAQTAAEKYADDKDAALKSAIKTDYEAADTATLNSAKAYTDELKNGQVTTNKTNIASMDTFVAPTVQMTVGEQAQTTVTGAINALDARITSATSGLATDGKMTELSNRVDDTEGGISDLQGRMTTAEGEIDTLQSEMDAVEVKAAANESAITVLKGSETTEGSVAKSVADAKAFVLQEASDMAGMAKADAKKYTDGEISALTTTVNGKASQADLDTAESAIADNAAAILLKASQADLDTAEAAIEQNKTDIATKANKAGYTAGQVVVTDSTGTITTAAEISNTQVAGLGGLATKTTIADADVADGAAIAQSKIAGLTTSLSDLQNSKVTIPTATGADGNYVLTATVVDNQATYKWESIERNVATPTSNEE